VPLWQTLPFAQTLLAQHGWPAAPHVWQVPLRQRVPEAQALFGQQVWPGLPHGWQIVPAQ
jgi:hypothetical protein